jgi:hypothetical protein
MNSAASASLGEPDTLGPITFDKYRAIFISDISAPSLSERITQAFDISVDAYSGQSYKNFLFYVNPTSVMNPFFHQVSDDFLGCRYFNIHFFDISKILFYELKR